MATQLTSTRRNTKKTANDVPALALSAAMFAKGKRPTEKQFAELGRRAHKFFTAAPKPDSEAVKVSSEFWTHYRAADELLMKAHAVANLLWADRDGTSEHDANVGWLLCDLIREARKELEQAHDLHYKLRGLATAAEQGDSAHA